MRFLRSWFLQCSYVLLLYSNRFLQWYSNIFWLIPFFWCSSRSLLFWKVSALNLMTCLVVFRRRKRYSNKCLKLDNLSYSIYKKKKKKKKRQKEREKKFPILNWKDRVGATRPLQDFLMTFCMRAFPFCFIGLELFCMLCAELKISIFLSKQTSLSI